MPPHTGCGCCVHCRCTGLCVDREADVVELRKPKEHSPSASTPPLRCVPGVPIPALRYTDEPLSPTGPAGPADGSKSLLAVIEKLPHPNDMIHSGRTHRSRPPSPEALTPIFAPQRRRPSNATPLSATAFERASKQTPIHSPSSSRRGTLISLDSSMLRESSVVHDRKASTGEVDRMNSPSDGKLSGAHVISRSRQGSLDLPSSPDAKVQERSSCRKTSQARSKESSTKADPVVTTMRMQQTSSLKTDGASPRRVSKEKDQNVDIEIRTWAPTPVLGTFAKPKNRRELDEDSDRDQSAEEPSPKGHAREGSKACYRSKSSRKTSKNRMSSESEEDERDRRNRDSDELDSQDDERPSHKKSGRGNSKLGPSGTSDRRAKERSASRKQVSEEHSMREKDERTRRQKEEQRKRDRDERHRFEAEEDAEASRRHEREERRREEAERKSGERGEQRAKAKRKESRREPRPRVSEDDDSDEQNERWEVKLAPPSADSSPPAYISRAPTPLTELQQNDKSVDGGVKKITIGHYTLTRNRTSPKDEYGSASLSVNPGSVRRDAAEKTRFDGTNDSKRERLFNYIDSVVGATGKETTRDKQPSRGNLKIDHANGAQSFAKLSPPPYKSAAPSRGVAFAAAYSSSLDTMHAISKLVVRLSSTRANTLHFIDMSRFDDDGGPLVAFRLEAGVLVEHAEHKHSTNLGAWIAESLHNGVKVQGVVHLGLGRNGPILFDINVKRRHVDKFVIQGAKDQAFGLSKFSDAPHWGEHDDYRHLYCRTPKGRTLKWHVQEPGKSMRLLGRAEHDYGHVYLEARLTGGQLMEGLTERRSKRRANASAPVGCKETTLLFYRTNEEVGGGGGGRGGDESGKKNEKEASLFEMAYDCASWWCARQTFDEGQVAAAHAEIEMIETIEKAFEVDLLAGA